MYSFLFDTLDELSTRDTDRERDGLSEDIDFLRGKGFFASVLSHSDGGCGLSLPEDDETILYAFQTLRCLGCIDLSLARIFEGHMNAWRLIQLYGDKKIKNDLKDEIRKGALLGVWGADGAQPLVYASHSDGYILLEGGKRFASGLGLIDFALVTMKDKQALAQTTEVPQQLALLPVRDEMRADHEDWKVSGMLASVSGAYDFNGLHITADQLVGQPGDFFIEPHFEGGVWRYSSAHLGGAERLVSEWIKLLRLRHRDQDPFQRARLAQAQTLLAANAAMLEKTALCVEKNSEEGKQISALKLEASLLARQFTEDACTKILELCEKSLGTAAYMTDQPIEKMRRDLGFFIRQAAPDAKLQRAATLILENDGARLW